MLAPIDNREDDPKAMTKDEVSEGNEHQEGSYEHPF